MQNNVKTIDPSSDLCAIVASLEDGETLILSPGVYRVDRHIVVDKDVVVKSSTGNSKDVVIVRAGSTAALIVGGSPTFENLTFVSESGESGDDANDQARYESCVAARGGSPTFVGCRATSADQSGFSVRGEGVSAKLVRCEARGTKHGGIFFDGRASGEIDECVFANNGLGCVDVEDTPGDRWVEIRNSRLVKSGFASLSLHNRGRARVVDSELVAHVTSCAEVNEDSTLEARSVRFRGLVPFDPTDEKAPDPAGIATANSTVRVVDSSFEDLVVGIYFHSSKVELERCRITAGRYSVLSPDADDNFAMKDCRLFREPILNMDRNPEYGQPDSDADDEDFDDDFGVSDAELDADFNDETGDNSDAGRDADDDEEFDDDDWERAYEIKSKKIEELLGRGAPIVNHAVIPYAVGGMFDGYFYPNSRYGGTFVVSQELVNPRFNAPGNSSFHSFELAMATRQKCPSRYTNEDDSSDDEEEADPLEKKFNIRLPFLKKALSNESEEERFVKTANVYMRIMTFIGRYVESYKTINRYETLEFPHDFDDEELAGRCFVFDALGTPYSNNKSATDLLASFDRDVYAFPGENKDEKTERDPDEPGTFGLLLIIELNRSEMNQARKEGGKNFIERLKQENVWPFSDLNRKKIK